MLYQVFSVRTAVTVTLSFLTTISRLSFARKVYVDNEQREKIAFAVNVLIKQFCFTK
jgi:hypothetical protein